MKNILLYIILLFAFACHQPAEKSQLSGILAGAYTLQSASNNKVDKDTSFPTNNQVMIFTEKHYIYGTIAPDSTTLFGLGSYFYNDSTIIEKNIFNSSTLDSTFETKLRVARSPSSLIQIQGESDEVGKTFQKMPAAENSDLDGAWEQVSFENITGTDTSFVKNKQYKLYQGGHFMWIHRYPSDSIDKKFQTGYGFGVFSIKGNTITETITSSSYKEIIEVPVTLSFTLTGKDQLVLEFNEGISVTKETYRRMN
ncbi:MAG TPA: hypothetical protein VK166_10170 [Chitinophagaceae bacterium]|nr:hypothetical protein [Chitinophagaceae bacterium]